MYRLNPLRWGCLLALLLLASSVQMAQAQLFSVTVASIDSLRDTAKYGMNMAGKGELAKQFDPIIDAYLQEGGIDTKKPMGAYLSKFPENAAQPAVVAYLPISSEANFLALLEKFNLTPSKEEKGTRSLGLPTGHQVYLKFKNNYLFICLDEDELKNPSDPAKLAAKFPANSLLHVHLGLSEIPQNLKDHFLAEIDKQLQSERGKKSGESDAEYQLRLMGMTMPRQAIEHLVMDSQSLNAAVMLDQKHHTFSFDTVLTPKPGSRLHDEMKAMSESKSQFNSILDSAPASMVYHGVISEIVRKDVDKLLDTIVKKAISDEKSLMKKALAEKIYQVIEPTLKANNYELALSMKSTGEGQPLTGLGALRVKNGKQIEELIKGLIVEMKERERQAIQVDADKAGDVNIHIINIPAEDKGSKDMIEAFGAARIAIAFHNDAIVVGLGKNSTEEVKRVVSSIGSAGTNPPPVQIKVHVKPFARFIKEAPVRKAFETIFTTPESDEVKFTVTGGDQLRWHLQMSTQFLKLVEAAEKAKGE